MGGAACGKSKTANNICAQLGFKGYDVELVDESIKDWTYIPRIPTSCDSFYLQACHVEREDIRLRAGVDLVISDSPILLQYFYTWYHKVPMEEPMLMVSSEFDRLYKPLYIFVNREDSFYDEVGRYEKLAEAKDIDRLMKNMMDDNNIQYKEFSCLDQEEIIKHIISEVCKSDV